MTQTDHQADAPLTATDRDGRLIAPPARVAWVSTHGSRTGRVVRVEHRGEPALLVIADDSGALVTVRAAGCVRVAEGRPA